MLNEYKFKRKLSLGFEIIQLVLLTICIYSSFVVMPHIVGALNDWRPQFEQPLVVRVVAENTTADAENKKEQVAKKVINTVENDLTDNLSTESIQKIVYNGLNDVDELKNTPYKLSVDDEIIPPKLMNGKLYPQQFHKTILLEISGGKGDNFFCAVFPNVCLTEDKHRKEEDKEAEENKEETKEENKEDTVEDEGKIKFVLFEKIFGKD